MSCDVMVRSPWKRPGWVLHAGLAILGLALAGVGVVLVDNWAGLLPYLGSTLFLIGGSGVALSDTGIQSIARLLTGASDRRGQLSEESKALEHRMAEAAEPICRKKRVPFVVAEACYVAARDWPDRVSETFRWYLLCQVVTVAVVTAGRDDPTRAQLSFGQLRKVAVSLHRTSRIPTDVVARILNVDPATVRDELLAGNAAEP